MRVVFILKDCSTDRAKDFNLKRPEQAENEGGRLVSLFSANCLQIVISEAAQTISHRVGVTQTASAEPSVTYDGTVSVITKTAAKQRAKRHENLSVGCDHLLRGSCKNQADGVEGPIRTSGKAFGAIIHLKGKFCCFAVCIFTNVLHK